MREPLTPDVRQKICGCLDILATRHPFIPREGTFVLNHVIALLDALEAAEARIDLLNEHISVLMEEADDTDARAIGKGGE